jgi:hypothetical protein
MMHFFADKFSGLRARGLAFFFIALRAAKYFLLWHRISPRKMSISAPTLYFPLRITKRMHDSP